MGDLTLSNVGAEHTDMMVECFPGGIEKRDLRNPETRYYSCRYELLATNEKS
jgi:hypothetical protein